MDCARREHCGVSADGAVRSEGDTESFTDIYASSIYNGGAPGVLYELVSPESAVVGGRLTFLLQLTACFWYALISVSLAEQASSLPSSGGGELNIAAQDRGLAHAS